MIYNCYILYIAFSRNGFVRHLPAITNKYKSLFGRNIVFNPIDKDKPILKPKPRINILTSPPPIIDIPNINNKKRKL